MVKDRRSEYNQDNGVDYTVDEELVKSAEVARFSAYVIVDVLMKEPPLAKDVLTKTVGAELRKFRQLAGPERTMMPAPLLQRVLKVIWGGA